MPAALAVRVSPVPKELVPSMPRQLTSPKAVRKTSASRYPAGVVGNSRSPRSRPTSSIAATWMVSAWVSAPPITLLAKWRVTVMMEMPSVSNRMSRRRSGEQTEH